MLLEEFIEVLTVVFVLFGLLGVKLIELELMMLLFDGIKLLFWVIVWVLFVEFVIFAVILATIITVGKLRVILSNISPNNMAGMLYPNL